MTFTTIVSTICTKFGVSTDAMKTIVKVYVNLTQQRVAMRTEELEYLQKRAFLTCVAPYETGTVAVSNGGTTVAGTDTVWTSAMTGRKIRIGGRDEYYTITYVSPTSLTLDSAYAGTAETAGEYIIFQDEYSLVSDVEKIISMVNNNQRRRIGHVDPLEFDDLYQDPTVIGNPFMRIPAGRDTSNYMKVQLYPIPDTNYVLPYRYRKQIADMSGDNDVSVIPNKYHELLILGGLAMAYEWDKKPNQAAGYWVQFDNMIDDMVTDLGSGSEDSVTVLGQDTPSFAGPTIGLDPSRFGRGR